MNETDVVALNQFTDVELELEGAEEEDKPPIDLDKPPTIDTKQRILEDWLLVYPHTQRGPNDVVISGPVIGGWGPGRYFRNRRLAIQHYIEKYGHARVGMVGGKTKGRWAVLIRNLRGENAA